MASSGAKYYNFLFKFIIIGDTHVGKSNVLLRFSEDIFQDSFQPTIGVDFKIKSINFENTPIKLQLWDTAGQERFRNITNSYYKGAHGIILVYDITNHNSFQNLDLWLEEVEKHGATNLTKILIGNKSDLEELRQVEKKEAEKLHHDADKFFADAYKIKQEAENYKKDKAEAIARADDAERKLQKERVEHKKVHDQLVRIKEKQRGKTDPPESS